MDKICPVQWVTFCNIQACPFQGSASTEWVVQGEVSEVTHRVLHVHDSC